LSNVQAYRQKQYGKLATTVISAPLNTEVDALNEEILDMFEEEEHVYDRYSVFGLFFS
jgi:hypothetical protein